MCFIQLTNYISEMCYTHGSTNPLVWSFVMGAKSDRCNYEDSCLLRFVHSVKWHTVTEVSKGHTASIFGVMEISKKTRKLTYGSLPSWVPDHPFPGHKANNLNTKLIQCWRLAWRYTSSTSNAFTSWCLHKRRGSCAITRTFTRHFNKTSVASLHSNIACILVLNLWPFKKNRESNKRREHFNPLNTELNPICQ